jgi:hypothetical protein
MSLFIIALASSAFVGAGSVSAGFVMEIGI